MVANNLRQVAMFPPFFLNRSAAPLLSVWMVPIASCAIRTVFEYMICTDYDLPSNLSL